MEIKSEQVIYRNSVLNCRTLDIQYQHQKVNGYLLVEPNNLEEKTGGVTGIVILACYKGEIFLLRTRRPGYVDRKSWYWELPRGFVNEGESIEEAAIRELEEEVGICNISIGVISNLGCISPEPGVIRGINKIIKLEIRDFVYKLTDANEEEEGIVDARSIAINKEWIDSERRNERLLDCATIIGLQCNLLEDLNAK